MPQKKVKKGAPPWMATFADLSTLLMTFFVLLLSFSSMDVQKFRDMLGSVQSAFGVQFQERGTFQPVIKEPTKPSENKLQEQLIKDKLIPTPTRDDSREVAVESAAMADKVKELVEETKLAKEVEILKGKRGVRLRVKGGLFFQPGRAALKITAKPFLSGVAKILDKSKFYLIIEGHTDNLPIHTEVFPTNWELSAARATAVVRSLVQEGRISAKRLAAIGFGPYYPLASNRTPEGRRKNRRVEFIFTKLSPRVAVK